MNIKVGLITQAGGAHLDLYFNALARAKEVVSVALADPDGASEAEARKILGDKLGRVYLDAPRMLEVEKPTMALISVEGRRGPAAISAALAAGCHVLAEKPACVNVGDFEKLVVEADQKKLLLMLALANRVNPEIVESLRIIDEGKIGKVFGLELHMIQDQTRLTRPEYRNTWFAEKDRAGGGHLLWLGLHWLDIAMFLTRSKITEVTGFYGNLGGQPLDVEDSAAVVMRFDNEALGTLTSGYYLKQGYQSHIKIWGSNGYISINSGDSESMRWHSETPDGEEIVGKFNAPSDFDAYTVFVHMAVCAAAGLQAPPITAAESLAALKTVFALYAAAESGQTQTLHSTLPNRTTVNSRQAAEQAHL